MKTKKKILIFIEWYLPGYKAGGPIKSISALVSHLQDEYDFFIITTDTDLGEENPYSSVSPDKWIKINDSVQIYYFSNKTLNWKNLLTVARSIKSDVLYLNSYFSLYFSIFPLLYKWLGELKTPVIIAPRGMLGAGALEIKSIKKRLFIFISKVSGWHKDVRWHATSKQEYDEIVAIYGKNTKVTIAPNLQYKLSGQPIKTTAKKQGELKLFFLSRISEKKNLLFALDILAQLKIGEHKIEFDIIGPIEDKVYWDECQKKIIHLNNSIKVNYIGAIRNEAIPAQLTSNHFLFLPTRNENYGHVIVESLINGKPVIISDQTPWKDMEQKKAGWDISLEKPQDFITTLERCIQMNQEEYNNWSIGAYEYAISFINNKNVIEDNRKLFST